MLTNLFIISIILVVNGATVLASNWEHRKTSMIGFQITRSRFSAVLFLTPVMEPENNG
jgi:hypothetical protein